jgi:molybdate transport system substrate-binding protein
VRFGIGVAVLLATVVALAGCGDDGDLTVFGASSLTEVLPAVDADATYQFAASDTLAAQIREGAGADVYVAANERLPEALFADGIVEEPRVFATNRLVILVPGNNPGRIGRAADLGRPGVRFLVAAEGVPLGDYSREALARLGLPSLVERATSFEDDARSIVAKVALGEVDAGIVYATDAGAAAGDVAVVSLPVRAQPTIRYAVAVVAGSARADAARAFAARLAGPQGAAILKTAGFGRP